jgi:hypothetical protein
LNTPKTCWEICSLTGPWLMNSILAVEWSLWVQGKLLTSKFWNSGKVWTATFFDLNQFVIGWTSLARLLEAKPSGPRERTRASSEASPTIFISHSSQDEDVIRVVKHAFDELDLTPLFNERHPTGGPPVETLVERIANSKALFVFFTFNSIIGTTRDWIIFELGAARAYDRPVFAWVQKAVGKDSLPKLLEQLTIYRPFEVQSNQGTIELVKDVRQAAKNLPL